MIPFPLPQLRHRYDALWSGGDTPRSPRRGERPIWHWLIRVLLAAGVGLGILGCDGNAPPATEQLEQGRSLSLTSPAFVAEAPIPTQHTCDGQDISPPLQWDTPPEGTASLTLLMEDPDAPGGTFIHWVLYDVPPDTAQLPEGVEPKPILQAGGVQGKNQFGNYGYGGPCPPRGTHQYIFRLYALNTLLDLPPGAHHEEVVAAMQGHILGSGNLIGTYSR